MLSVASLAQAVAPRACRPNPPAGTPSRLLRLRLRKAFHAASTPHAAVPSETRPAEANRSPHASRRYPPPARPSDPPPFPLELLRAGSVPTEVARSLSARSPPIVRLLRAVQAEDAQAVVRWLSQHAGARSRPHGEEGGEGDGGVDGGHVLDALASLPQTTFSEILRGVDPVRVSRLIDAADGVSIPNGLRQFTSGWPLDEFGIRRVYTDLLTALIRVFRHRMAFGNRFILSDFVVMMRCAGAASRPRTAKAVWRLMDDTNRVEWRQADAYNEFLRARLLLDPLYSQYDLERMRVKPLGLHLRKAMIPRDKLSQLHSLRLSIRKQAASAFRMDPDDENLALDLSDAVRPKTTIGSALGFFRSRDMVDEKIVCSTLVALGRAAALKEMKLLLADVVGISIKTDRESGHIHISGGRAFHDDSPLKPTAQLLDAIVQGFCANAEVVLARNLIEFVAQRYDLSIPDETWSSLLHWTYLCASEPCSTEWRILGFPQKVVHPRQIVDLWAVMTSEPYNVKPKFDDQTIYVKALLSLASAQRYQATSHIAEAVSQMREMKAQHAVLDIEYQDSIFREILASTQLVTPTDARLVKERARLRKQLAWYSMQRLCQRLLNVMFVDPRLRDEAPTRIVPELVEEFQDFLPCPARYRVPGGIVRLSVPANALPRFSWKAETVVPPRSLYEVPVWERDGEGQIELDEYGRRVLKDRVYTVVQQPTLRKVRKARRLERLPWQTTNRMVDRRAIERELIW